MHGVIIWSTVEKTITGIKSLIGRSIDDILLPSEAKTYKMHLLKAAFGQGPQWCIYTIQDYSFLSLLEHIRDFQSFIIYEVKIVSKESKHIANLKKKLLSLPKNVKEYLRRKEQLINNGMPSWKKAK